MNKETKKRMCISQPSRNVRLTAAMAITMTFAIVARRGSGKTYLAMVLAEEFLKYPAIPIVVIDPTGVWSGLRARPDGRPTRRAILTLGGRKGDLPVRPDQGKAAASVVAAIRPHSVLIDLSDMMPEEQHLFVGDFGTEFFMKTKTFVHLFVDEADEFAAQAPQNGRQQRARSALSRIVRRGRVKGIGVTMITQRPAVIDKNALSQIDALFLLSVNAPPDLSAIRTWLTMLSSAQQKECLEGLPRLDKGDGYFVRMSPATFSRFTVRAKRTYDSSRTPEIHEPNVPEPNLAKTSERIKRRAAKILGPSLWRSDDQPPRDGTL